MGLFMFAVTGILTENRGTVTGSGRINVNIIVKGSASALSESKIAQIEAKIAINNENITVCVRSESDHS